MVLATVLPLEGAEIGDYERLYHYYTRRWMGVLEIDRETRYFDELECVVDARGDAAV